MTTVEEIKELKALFAPQATPQKETVFDNGMIGEYVIVRCRDAGVHAGILKAHSGRECLLSEARRLWYWKVAEKGAFLSGVAMHGLDSSSKIGEPIEVHLTETCEIIRAAPKAEKSIRMAKTYVTS